jgi:hypothetical protein
LLNRRIDREVQNGMRLVGIIERNHTSLQLIAHVGRTVRPSSMWSGL